MLFVMHGLNKNVYPNKHIHVIAGHYRPAAVERIVTRDSMLVGMGSNCFCHLVFY